MPYQAIKLIVFNIGSCCYCLWDLKCIWCLQLAQPFSRPHTVIWTYRAALWFLLCIQWLVLWFFLSLSKQSNEMSVFLWLPCAMLLRVDTTGIFHARRHTILKVMMTMKTCLRRSHRLSLHWQKYVHERLGQLHLDILRAWRSAHDGCFSQVKCFAHEGCFISFVVACRCNEPLYIMEPL